MTLEFIKIITEIQMAAIRSVPQPPPEEGHGLLSLAVGIFAALAVFYLYIKKKWHKELISDREKSKEANREKKLRDKAKEINVEKIMDILENAHNLKVKVKN